MIVSFSGRKGSGKTLLAQSLIERGFIKISFADKLKELVSQIYDWNLDDLQILEKKEELLETPVQWNTDSELKLALLINANKPFVAPYREFKTRREALQYIGSEVIRSYDENFHVNSIKEKIESDKNYVLDDTRFKNEIELLKSLGALCIFVLRPSLLEYSNHQSEISLNRNDFEYVIINSLSKDRIVKRFLRFINQYWENRFSNSRFEFVQLLERHNYQSISAAKELGCSRDKIVWWAERYMIPLFHNKYKYRHNAFLNATPESAYWAGLISADGCVKKSGRSNDAFVVELASDDLELVEGFKNWLHSDKPIHVKKRKIGVGKVGYSFTVNSPYIVEDMKLWNIEPRKSKHNKIPDIIKNDNDLLCHWLIGLIDGDGSIYRTTSSGNLTIMILASSEIINFIKEWSKIPCSLSQEKKIDNLYSIRFSGTNAMLFYDKIYREIGLNRKWSKCKDFELYRFEKQVLKQFEKNSTV